ncbi:MAG: hypothetical protein TREMPRED_001389 [Tremellales sp. Tagirdzhanova-0007]|nr:MAG: hypothetical protein TREMPRED_001389 [Tremellales sp. Tagirdzhanova-0007]
MPPPPATSISALTSSYPPPQPRPHSPPLPSSSTAPSYHQPLTLPPPPFSSTSVQRPSSSFSESRLNNLESSMRSQSNTMVTIQASIEYLQRSHDSLIAVQQRSARARETVIEVPETVWETYRSRAWPLTPWLVGLREAQGLPGLVVNWLGKRIKAESRREGENAIAVVMIEVGRLVADRVDWTREEIRALGVLAMWSKNTTLACLAIGLARTSGLNRISSPLRTQDDWREWIYLTIMDQLCQVPELQEPSTNDTLAPAWRDRLISSAPGDTAVRDRDLKLLAWLEHSETLVEVYRAQQRFRLAGSLEFEVVAEDAASERDEREREGETPLPGSRSEGATEERDRETERRRAMEPWRKWATKWEAWAGGWAARNDLILSLHYNYAVLFTASPVFLASASVWGDLARSHDGYQQLERGRDAAAAVIHAICSPEIRPTLFYSFALYRPLLAHALTHLISLVTSLPDSTLISQSFVQTVLRSIYDALVEAKPVDQIPNSLIAEMVETGQLVGLGQREVLGVEPGRELWRRILG